MVGRRMGTTTGRGCSAVHIRARMLAMESLMDILSKSFKSWDTEVHLSGIWYTCKDIGQKLLSLPAEILGMVFEYVTDNASVEKSMTAARTLSYVNRRFRTVALACPRLWTSIHFRWQGNSELLEDLLRRSGDCDLRIVGNTGCYDFYCLCLSFFLASLLTRPLTS